MNRGSDRLRVLLMGAVAAGVFGPQQLVHAAGPGPVPAVANSKKPGTVMAKPAVATVPPRLLPASGTESSVILPVSQKDAAPNATAGKKSEVMRQLELLYQQDGREMPDLNTDIKPVPTGPNAAGAGKSPATPVAAPAATQPPAAPNGLRTQQPATVQKGPSTAPATTSATTSSKSKYPVIAFFQKLVPGKKDPKPTPAPTNYRPDVAPVPPAIVSQPPAQLRHDPLIGTTASNSGQALPLLASQPRAPFVAVIGQPEALPKPLAGFGDIPPSPNAGSPLAAPQPGELPPLLADAKSPETTPTDIPQAPAVADASNPFTEMSEAEADQKLELNPFTGLTLDTDAGSANASSGASSKSPKTDAPSPAAPTVDDPFADELKKMGIVPPGAADVELPKLTPPTSESPNFDGIEDQATREKMKKIHERGSMKGLKGFCPVTLRDQRELVDAKPEFHSTFRGQKFHFADADAKLKFDEEPARYAPAAYGADVVALTRDKDVVEGTLDFAAWFKGRLYLFGTAEAHDTFVVDPSKYATPVGIE